MKIISENGTKLTSRMMGSLERSSKAQLSNDGGFSHISHSTLNNELKADNGMKLGLKGVPKTSHNSPQAMLNNPPQQSIYIYTYNVYNEKGEDMGEFLPLLHG